ncbi:MAG: hypothetical protein DMG65_15495 [Candidatus Angelobacter sp. Gp1-AA117]|nr:MAG: hypothetical protein DMG65_15495 [Candidatus Angelobacter sp. Gp1-AA117]
MKTALFIAFFLIATLAPAQNSQRSSQQPPPPSAQAGAQKPGTGQSSKKDEPEKEHIVTAQETKELFQSVDEILHFASKDTLLPIKHPVKKAMVSRAEVEKYVGTKFEDDADRIRFERSELVLKKFGLLPRQFNLHDFLIKLLGEQVAGYYDEKTKTINLLNWVALDLQKPVMAHELTHALQDQSFDLEKMVKKEEEIEKRGPEDPNALIKIDEESTCRTAIMEGQAMIVLLDYILAPGGKSVQTSPEFVDIMQAQMEKKGDSPIFESAPLLLREELTFPYSEGMKFVRDLLVAGGKELAFTKVLERMPTTTREIMEPQEYLAGRHISPLLLPDFSFLKKDYEAFDAGAVGEIDVSILLKQYTEEEIAKRLTPDWRGGAYYAVGRRGVKPSDLNSSAHIGLIYLSKWAGEKAAEEFSKIYASALPGRYNKVNPEPLTQNPLGWTKYLTSDGPVFILQVKNLVIAIESFDDATASKIAEAALKQMDRDSGPKVVAQTQK